MARRELAALGMGRVAGDSLHQRHDLLTIMLGAAAKPHEYQEWRPWNPSEQPNRQQNRSQCHFVTNSTRNLAIDWHLTSESAVLSNPRSKTRSRFEGKFKWKKWRGVGNAKPRRHERKKYKTEAIEDREVGLGNNDRTCKSRSSLGEVIEKAKSPVWLAAAKRKFEQKFYAAGTWASRASKRKKVLEIAESCGFKDGLVTCETLSSVAAALDEAKMQSAEQYLAELKWIHVESGSKWDEVLERRLQLCKRALKRDIGPEKRALEVKPNEVTKEALDLEFVNPKFPKHPVKAYVWACLWMLRAVEAAGVKREHVQVSWKPRWIRLYIPKSKKDQEAKGVSRTLQCCGESTCSLLCPWFLGVKALEEAGAKSCGPLCFLRRMARRSQS